MVGQVLGVQPWLSAVHAVGESEQPGEVPIASAGHCQQRQPGPVGESELTAGDGPDAQAAGQPCKRQRSAQIGIG